MTAERTFVLSPIGLLPVDDFTGGAPVGWLRAILDRFEDRDWRPTDLRAMLTPRGVLAYPGLERRANAAAAAVRYRVRLEAEFYVPFYPPRRDGSDPGAFEFDARPYNEATQPAGQAPTPAPLVKALLLPAANYPFPPEVPVLRGVVLLAASHQPVARATVRRGNTERVLTNDRGEFGLPLRWTKLKPPVVLPFEAEFGNSGPKDTINVRLPDDLGKSQTFNLS
jgi:hypothetical protein